jgi:hypothetical protein
MANKILNYYLPKDIINIINDYTMISFEEATARKSAMTDNINHLSYCMICEERFKNSNIRFKFMTVLKYIIR